MKIFILEDDINRVRVFADRLGRQHTLVFADTAQKAIEIIQGETEGGQSFDVMFLDHDLGGEIYVDTEKENTGSGLARWMEGYEAVYTLIGQPVIVIHSLNPAGVHYMAETLKKQFSNIHTIPFTCLLDKYLDDPSFLSQ